jgi:hypothetical protein
MKSLRVPPEAEEEMSRANTDVVFELACRFIVVNSMPGWIDEICAEHFQSHQSGRTEEPGDRAFPADGR